MSSWRKPEECVAEAAERKIKEQQEELERLSNPPKGSWGWALGRLKSGAKVRRKEWRSAERIWAKDGLIMWYTPVP